MIYLCSTFIVPPPKETCIGIILDLAKRLLMLSKNKIHNFYRNGFKEAKGHRGKRRV